ncbi:hypothetical protein, partial [Candidatus Albibeggiatoa sp. nov. BB20]|uniref:hypothetical protein n=1 Tax=Candidatus Albibeggiatoa sp. nov. BB20 TaxID=3162723 RepID=UPI003365363D
MKTIAYRLFFKTPFHLDERGTGFYQHSNTFIRSDMLSAAILSSWKMLDSNLAELYFREPPFLLSSCFPFFEHQTPENQNSPDCHYFLPRPVMDKAVNLDKEYLGRSKEIKKIEWLEKSIWEKSADFQLVDNKWESKYWNWNHDFCEKDKEYTIIENNLLLP